MKKIILILILAYSHFFSLGQATFENIYEYPDYNNLGDIVLTSDDYLLIIAYDLNSLYIIKTDLTGQVIWEKIYTLPFLKTIKQVIETPSGDFVLAGHHNTAAWFFKFSQEGDSIWTRYLLEPDISQTAMAIDFTNDGIMAAGVTKVDDYYPYTIMSRVELYSESGNYIGICVVPFEGKIQDIEFLNDTTLLYSWDQKGNYTYQSYLSVCTLDGISISEQGFTGFYANNFTTDTDCNVYMATQSSIVNFQYENAAYSLSWQNYILPGAYKRMGEIVTEDEFVFITGGMDSTYNKMDDFDLFLMSLNSTGDILKTIIDTNYYRYQGKKLLLTNALLIVGGDVKITEESQDDIFVNVYNRDYILRSNEVLDQSTKDIFHVFPNPASGSINFELNEINNSEPAEIQIFDLNGKQVEQFLLAGNKSTLNISNLVNGVYFYKIIVAGDFVSGKIIIKN